MAQLIEDHGKLAEILENLKATHKKVVMANGCFDLLHVGHIRYLKEAKEHGDVLVVALNSDESMEDQKRKPIIPQYERAEMLLAIKWVDYVTFFSEPTVDELLLRLKPDVHAKGTDYTEASVPERLTVLSYGGKVAIVGDPKSHSSSQIIEHVLKHFCKIEP